MRKRNVEETLMEKTDGFASDGYHAGTTNVTVTATKSRNEETVSFSVAGSKIRVPYYVVEDLMKRVRAKYVNNPDEPLPGQIEL